MNGAPAAKPSAAAPPCVRRNGPQLHGRTMEMQNTDITFDARGSRVEEGYLPQRDSEAELNEYNRQTDEEIAALAAAFGGRFKEEGYGEE